MSKKNFRRWACGWLFSVALLSVGIWFGLLYFNTPQPPIQITYQTYPSATLSAPASTTITTTAPKPATEKATATISLSIQNLYDRKSVAIVAGETMLALLTQQNAADPKMRLTTQEYSGLGALVTSIGGLTNGADKQYWQYRVNGVEPQIGASGYILKSGDAVEWVFAPSMQ